MNDTFDENDKVQERDIARLLEVAGPREELPEDLKRHWENHFRAELQSVRKKRRQGFLLPLIALAASIVVLVLVVDFFAGPAATATSMQVHAVAGQGQVILDERRRVAAIIGQHLSEGVAVETMIGGRMALTWAGFDVRLNQKSRLRLHRDHLALEAGEIYVSNRDRRISRRQVTVVTPYATVSDIGTQFKVRLSGDGVVASVRQGSILVRTDAGEHRADASADGGRTLFVGEDQSVQVTEDRTDWAWIYPVAESFELEGRTVFQFLRWSTGESGRQYRFADEEAALAARNARFSGGLDLANFDPDEALALVLSTTRFEARVQSDGSLLVSRRSE
jgi:ferric-dicitrate binding protein FerR (iron transport regulator)